MNDSGNNPSDERSLENRIAELGGRLCLHLNQVLDAIPGAPKRPTTVARTLGVNKVLASRALQAAEEVDPLAATHAMPGPEALRILLKAASRQKINPTLISSAEIAVAEYDDLLRSTLGGRAGLEALLASWLPETRKRFETSNKQAAFKANCALKGTMTETVFNTAVIYPSEDPTKCDGLFISGLLGLRRLRPDTPLVFTTHCSTQQANDSTWTTLDGTPIDTASTNTLLTEFSSQPLPNVDVEAVGTSARHLIKVPALGTNNGLNIIGAEVFRGHLPRYAKLGSDRRQGAAADVEQPSELLVLDILLHEDIWQGATPELSIYDTTLYGRGAPNDPTRDIARLRLEESIQFLGTGTTKFRITGIPQYVTILRYALDKLGWDGHKLRGYRCRIDYPFYGSETFMGFIPPPPPAG